VTRFRFRISLRLRIAIIIASLAVVAAQKAAGFEAMTIVGVTAIGAGAYLVSHIGDALREMQAATGAIAEGCFDHRIESQRTDELGDLSRSIDGMAARLCDLDASRHQLLASVSHELRTPLTVIRGQAYTLSRTESDPQRAEKFELIEQESQRLALLIDDLLTASTMRATPIKLAPQLLDCEVALQATALRFRAQAEQRDIAIEVKRSGDQAIVAADRGRFDQILGNLVSNAIAHAPPHSTVHLTSNHSGGSVRVGVANSGPGIPTHAIDRIFEPFEQGDQPTGAVGLGLTVARELVRAHGGTLAVRSRRNATEFWFTLPIARAHFGPAVHGKAAEAVAQ
jgi:signal transduction histidine kinase